MGWCYPEYGRLRTVVMHAPGAELDLINPRTYERFLFADAVDAERFRSDHERFVDVLRSEGVNVVLLAELLRDQTELLRSMERLPNLVYTRDTAAVTRSGYVLARMKNSVRQAEARIVETALQRLGISTLMRPKPPATLEGGDAIFLDEDTLLLGVGNRTSKEALHQIATVGTKSGLRRLIAVPLPPSVIHLDGTMMVIDRDLVMVHRPSLRGTASVFEGGRLSRRADFLRFLSAAGMSLIDVTEYERQRRGANVICVGPRKVVGYGGNARLRRELIRNGVDLIEIEGSELIRGFGGPRCMTLPTLRE